MNFKTSEMREIKFRVFSEELKRFVYGFYQEVEAEGIGYSYIFWQGHTTPVRADTIDQFTGLKDKNGVEIFEGDKIKYKNFKGYSKIVFENGAFGYYGVSCFISLLETNTDYIEVIGNIHANPELI